MSFDRAAWDERWAQVLRDHGDQLGGRPPNGWLTELAGDLPPGRALDAGCGHGAETLWLAARGWHVTAVDFAPSVLEHARRTAADVVGADAAARIEWVEGDLGTWTPPSPESYDLVACLYVHVAGEVEELVGRLASGVADGGALLLVGHLPVDPATGLPTRAADQRQVTVADATRALDPAVWELVVAEDRPRPAAGTGADALVWARRRSPA